MIIAMLRGVKIQGWGAHYDRWVLTKLIELGLETSENALVGRIVREWIEAKADDHRRLNLTPEAFLDESRSTGAKLYSFPKPEHPDKSDEPSDLSSGGLGIGGG
jgi:hypothetical protein